MRQLLLILFLLAAPLARAEGTAGKFDYYVLSLSWSSNWCKAVGDARQDPQCEPGQGLNFTLHGLWPQYEAGYPSDCSSSQPNPSRSQTAAMADIMGGAGLAWHEWQKHGRCTGLSAEDYFATARLAYDSVIIPRIFQRMVKTVLLRPAVVTEAFLQANPGLKRQNIGVTCEKGLIQEVRICLTKDLAPRPCGADAAQQCRLSAAEMDAQR